MDLSKHRWFGRRSPLTAREDVAKPRKFVPVEMSRLMALVERASCRNWEFTVGNDGERITLKVFHPDPADPKRLASGQARELPGDAGLDEVRSILAEAVAAIGGDEALRDLRFRED